LIVLYIRESKQENETKKEGKKEKKESSGTVGLVWRNIRTEITVNIQVCRRVYVCLLW
jgi:hypothetical protein